MKELHNYNTLSYLKFELFSHYLNKTYLPSSYLRHESGQARPGKSTS